MANPNDPNVLPEEIIPLEQQGPAEPPLPVQNVNPMVISDVDNPFIPKPYENQIPAQGVPETLAPPAQPVDVGVNTVLQGPIGGEPEFQAEPMVTSAVQGADIDGYKPDKQHRFETLMQEEFQRLVDSQSASPTRSAQLYPPNEAELRRQAEDLALQRLMDEDAEVQAGIDARQAEKNAQAQMEIERKKQADALGIALPSQTDEIAATKDALATPSEPEIEAEATIIRKQSAQDQAQQRVAREQQAIAIKKEEQIQEQAQKNVEQAEFSSLGEVFEKGSVAQKLGAALAVMAGAISQGFTGGNQNPVMSFLDNHFKGVMERRKMKKEEEAAEKEAMYKQARLLLDKTRDQWQNKLNKAQIDKIYGDLAQGELEARNAQMNALRLKAGLVTDPSQLPEDQQDRAVRLPDGSYRLATNKKQAEKLEEYRNEVEPAIEGIDRINNFLKNYNFIDPRDRVQIASELQAMIGQLRLPFTGPGVLTEPEYERLKEAIGDPNKILTLTALEKRKLNTVRNKLTSDLKKRYFNAGINLPQSKKEKATEYLMNKYNLSKEKAEKIIEQRQK